MKFENYIKAGYPCLWVQTHEEGRAISVLTQEVQGYNIYSWDLVGGMLTHANGNRVAMPDPLQPFKAIQQFPEKSILFLKDFHKFITSVEVFRSIKNLIPILKITGKHLVFISPVVNIPVELEKDITLVDFELPTIAELLQVAREIVEGNEININIDERAIAAGKGLTLAEAENAMALSLVAEKAFSKKIIEKEKLQAIKKSGLMELYEPVDISQLGGLIISKNIF